MPVAMKRGKIEEGEEGEEEEKSALCHIELLELRSNEKKRVSEKVREGRRGERKRR